MGCGDGVLTAEIKARGCQVVGIDFAPDMIAAANKRVRHLVQLIFWSLVASILACVVPPPQSEVVFLPCLCLWCCAQQSRYVMWYASSPVPLLFQRFQFVFGFQVFRDLSRDTTGERGSHGHIIAFLSSY